MRKNVRREIIVSYIVWILLLHLNVCVSINRLQFFINCGILLTFSHFWDRITGCKSNTGCIKTFYSIGECMALARSVLHSLLSCFVDLRQRGRFAGFSLYVSNNGDIQGSTLCYKDGPQFPPLDFTTICTMYGRYVIFYNERLDGVVYPEGYQTSTVYTELCEVNVHGNIVKDPTYKYIDVLHLILSKCI